jgi:hypothetical protein
MDDSDDFFGEQEAALSVDPSNSTTKVSQKLYNDGYRIGKSREEERRIQESFDMAFRVGMQVGKVSGAFLERLQRTTAVDKTVLDYIMDDFPVSFCTGKAESLSKLRQLLRSVCSSETNTQLLEDLVDELSRISDFELFEAVASSAL